MIPCLFDTRKDIEKDKTSGLLTDCLSCTVTEEKNSIFECIFVYPISGNYFQNICEGKYIKVMCNNAPNMQIFRIYRRVGNERGTVTFYCEHISYLLNSVAVLPFTPTTSLMQCQDALTHIQGHMRPFSSKWQLKAETQIKYNFYGLKNPTTVREALLSEDHIMGVNHWNKGEYEFDNYNIILHEKRGKQSNVILNYGKNIKSIEHDISIGNTYTHMLPYLITHDENSDEDVVVTLSKGNTFDPENDALLAYPNCDKYKDKKVKIVDYSSNWSGTTNGAKYSLEQLAKSDIEYNKAFAKDDLPTANITISYIDLIKSMEYNNMQNIDKLRLCDWVILYYSPLGINVDIQIVRTVYDVLRETYKEIGLSNPTEKL